MVWGCSGVKVAPWVFQIKGNQADPTAKHGKLRLMCRFSLLPYTERPGDILHQSDLSGFSAETTHVFSGYNLNRFLPFGFPLVPATKRATLELEQRTGSCLLAWDFFKPKRLRFQNVSQQKTREITPVSLQDLELSSVWFPCQKGSKLGGSQPSP